MTLTQIFLLIALFFAFASVILVVNSRASQGQKWMLISTISIFVYISQLYFGLYSTSVEMIMATRKILYSASVFLVMSAAFGISYICELKIPKPVKIFYVTVSALSMPLMWSVNHHNYWFKSYTVVEQPEELGGYLVFKPEMGPLFYIVNIFLLSSFVIWMVHAIILIIRRKGRRTRAIRTFAICLGVPTLAWFLSLIGVFPLLNANILMMLGLAATIVVLQYRYNMTETVPIAKEQVVETTNEGVIILDRYGQFVFANTPAKGMFPILKDEGADKTLFVESKLNTNKIQINDRIIALTSQDVINSGKQHGTIIWARDITEDELAKENLLKLKIEADNANAAKSNFLANMSHEIRTPINAVLGFDEMILRETKDENITHYAESIKESGQALLYIINDILDLSKVESGKMSIIDVEYDLSKAINEMLTMVVPRAAASSNQLIYHVDSNIPRKLYGDEIRIRQVITNILTNAVKYTDSGIVELNVTLNGIENDLASIHVSVKDTGIGIKPEDLKDLFDAFKRVDEVKNRNVEGTGLGLNITASLLKMMNSELNVTSTYGEGSEFYFDIVQRVIDKEPIGDFDSEYKIKLRNSQVYREGFVAPNARILVVDDNALNIEVFKGLLKNTKISITSANGGQEAIDILLENDFDLMFLDHKMPKMDGIETLHVIKKMQELSNKSMKIVALTANAVLGAKEYYLNEGFDDYLMKPIIGEDLETLIKTYLDVETVEIEAVKTGVEPEKDSKQVTAYSEKVYDVSNIPVELSTKEELINIQSGLSYCANDKEIYGQLIDIFKESGLDDELIQYYNLEDWDNYEVIAHSVKSNAKTIGADYLSEYAKAMEFAIKYGKDIEFVKAHHEGFIAFYRKTVEVV